MTKRILEISFLKNHPKIINKKFEDFEFWIPSDYLNEYYLRDQKFSKQAAIRFITFLEVAIKNEVIKVIKHYDKKESNEISKLLNKNKHISTDDKYVLYARGTLDSAKTDLILFYKHEVLNNNDIAIYTSSNKFKKEVAVFKMKIFEVNQVLEELKTKVFVEIFEVQKSLYEYIELKDLDSYKNLFRVFTNLLLLFTIVMGVFNVPYIEKTYNFLLSGYKLVLFPLLLLIPVFLFWLRTNHKFLYGIAEVIFGYSLIVKELFFTNEIILDYKLLFTFLSALYVIIRGMDNIEKDMGQKRNLEYIFTKWKNIFSDKQKPF